MPIIIQPLPPTDIAEPECTVPPPSTQAEPERTVSPPSTQYPHEYHGPRPTIICVSNPSGRSSSSSSRRRSARSPSPPSPPIIIQPPSQYPEIPEDPVASSSSLILQEQGYARTRRRYYSRSPDPYSGRLIRAPSRPPFLRGRVRSRTPQGRWQDSRSPERLQQNRGRRGRSPEEKSRSPPYRMRRYSRSPSRGPYLSRPMPTAYQIESARCERRFVSRSPSPVAVHVRERTPSLRIPRRRSFSRSPVWRRTPTPPRPELRSRRETNSVQGFRPVPQPKEVVIPVPLRQNEPAIVIQTGMLALRDAQPTCGLCSPTILTIAVTPDPPSRASTHKENDNATHPSVLPSSKDPPAILVKPYVNFVHAVGLPHLLKNKEDEWKPAWKVFPLKVFRGADYKILKINASWDDEALLTELGSVYDDLRTFWRKWFSLRSVA